MTNTVFSQSVGSEVITEVTVKDTDFWGVMTDNEIVDRRFGKYVLPAYSRQLSTCLSYSSALKMEALHSSGT